MESGFCVSDKASTVGSFSPSPPPLIKMTMMSHHHYPHHRDDHHRPSSSRTISLPPSCGPINSNSGGKEVAVGCSWSSGTHIYHHDGSTSASAAAAGAAASASVLRRRRRTFQSVDIFSTPASRSPEGGRGMAAALGFPFTMAQWKELQRQAMIYKYMVASLPVPPFLLCSSDQDPAVAATHSSLGGGGSVFNLSLKFSNSKDPEPGRCKRTDGKKWRCSRDVAPNQKYCERHMHRGRPRSRKPVELHSPFTTTTNNNKKPRSALPPTPKPTSHSPISSSPHLLESTMQPPNGGLDWAVEQEWQHLLQTNIGLTSESSAVFQQDCIQEPLNLISYADFAAPEADQQSEDCPLFVNPDLLGFHSQPQIETPRGFIDAWSNEDLNANNNSNNESSVSSHSNNLSPSSLTLSMAMTLDEEMDNQQKPQVSSWVNPVSWLDSPTPGGPLAEVLNHSSVAENSAPSFPFPCNEDSTRPSSPSDGSGCASPTVAASKTMPFQWLS